MLVNMYHLLLYQYFKRDYNAAFLCHCWFLFIVFHDGAVDMQIGAFWQKVRVESLIFRWLLRPVGLLFKGLLRPLGLLSTKEIEHKNQINHIKMSCSCFCRVILLESRPTDSPSVESNLYVLAGHENNFWFSRMFVPTVMLQTRRCDSD